jgi:hypothetical protein
MLTPGTETCPPPTDWAKRGVLKRPYLEYFIVSDVTTPHIKLKKTTNTGVYIPKSIPK